MDLIIIYSSYSGKLDVSSMITKLNVQNGMPMASDGNCIKRAPPGSSWVHLTAAGWQVRPIGSAGSPSNISGSHFRCTYVAPASH